MIRNLPFPGTIGRHRFATSSAYQIMTADAWQSRQVLKAGLKMWMLGILMALRRVRDAGRPTPYYQWQDDETPVIVTFRGMTDYEDAWMY